MRYKDLEHRVRVVAFQRLFNVYAYHYDDNILAFLKALEITNDSNPVDLDLAEEWASKVGTRGPQIEVNNLRYRLSRKDWVLFPREPRYRKVSSQKSSLGYQTERQEIRDNLVGLD